MSHKQTSSVSSHSSSLTALSSTECAASGVSNTSAEAVRSESYKEAVHSVETGSSSTEALVEIAKSLIETLATSDKDVYEFGGSKLTLHPVLCEMLSHAHICGGSKGTRSTASRITACIQDGDPTSEATIGMLYNLATTWVSHFLYIFKSSRSHSTQPNKEPSETATPSRTDTKKHLKVGLTPGNRRAGFRDDILKRDGYQCIVTGVRDLAFPVHLQPGVPPPFFPLEGCHIIRRAVAVFNREDPDQYLSALTTWDILRNFAQLLPVNIEDLRDLIDAPPNGFLLQHDAHNGFDRFAWCLEKTEVENRYTVKIFDEYKHSISGLTKGQVKVVEFYDHSDEFRTAEERSSPLKRSLEVPLPSPHYISVHAAIAGVLHMSGAGKFLDELLDKFDPDRN
ncbi:hypothetical protein Hypma_001069 [Hypsizygus marmoreus]|uniref:HNH nuclease domain-containing protein n=1 Tax=Hypsizygus marmoreus TaxID=39966 RepID=A0A369J6Q0_HYPMA|nr:hypothetical protein Hypma_001069 [Hypsizygus marmoreus]